MKYLKNFKIFESASENEIFDNVEDILLDIKDEGFSVEIIKNEDSSDQRMEGDGELVRLYIESGQVYSDTHTPSPYKPTNIFIDTFDRLLSYLNDSDYTCSMEIVGECGNSCNETVAFSEFEEGDMSVKEMILSIKYPINYIRFIIYKPE